MKKRLVEGDMFNRTRSKLTLQYSGVLIVFLSLFVIIVYTLLYFFIWNDQHQRLNDLADSEIRNVQVWANRDDNPLRPPPREVEDTFSISADQSFYYLVDTKGVIQLGDEIQSELREQVLALAAEGLFEEQGINKVVMQTYDNPAAIGEGLPKEGSDAKFLITSRNLLWNGERIATLYLGKEVTFQDDLFRWLLILLLVMALLFFVLATWFSHLMSRGAMVPIIKAYSRQLEFVADASHELRTPLSVMLASIEALELEEQLVKEPFARSTLAHLKDEVKLMTKLSGDLLYLARSDSSELSLNMTLFDANKAASEVMGKLRPLAAAKELSFALQAPNEWSIHGDEEKFRQLLVLLLDNAIKYTPNKGTVLLTLAEEIDKGSRSISLEVKDTGIGIPAEALAHIFSRFYRQDKSRTRQSGGHGLGLAIAKSIVDASRGTIHVDSKLGQGSTFKVRLPWS
jgi:signal transduction histidine kinase